MSSHLRVIALAISLTVGTRMLPGQSISSFTPTFGAASDSQFIYITGTGLYPGPSGTLTVTFNGTIDPTAVASAVNGTMITAKVPAGAALGPGPICVSVNSGSPACSSDDFVVIGSGPYINDISPTNGSAT